MTNKQQFDIFVHHAALAFFASAWADQAEENGESLRGEIMDQIPEDIDPAAIHAATTLAMDMERLNSRSIAEMMEDIIRIADGDRPETLEYFGHYAAMQAMGHGVGLYDAFGKEVYELIKVPYIEFGSYSLERDYFCNGQILSYRLKP